MTSHETQEKISEYGLKEYGKRMFYADLLNATSLKTSPFLFFSLFLAMVSPVWLCLLMLRSIKKGHWAITPCRP